MRTAQPRLRGTIVKHSPEITSLFLDIGGFPLTDGWDQHARKRVATHSKLGWAEIQDRHHLACETYEKGSSRWKTT